MIGHDDIAANRPVVLQSRTLPLSNKNAGDPRISKNRVSVVSAGRNEIDRLIYPNLLETFQVSGLNQWSSVAGVGDPGKTGLTEASYSWANLIS
jgi:hypothetical protein